jgi:hypothetical protein
MGRFVLLTALLLAACLGEAPPRATGDSSATADDGPVGFATGVQEDARAHSDLACAACHRGDLADRSIDAVPPTACTASGCHADGGPSEVTVNGVTFPHPCHAGDQESVATSCAGCHYHDTGSQPLSGERDACGLCHAEELGGESPNDCRLCHQVPAHQGVTSQGLPVPHEGMPWIEGECLRCHYDVEAPSTGVDPSSCGSCHRDVESVTERSIGEDVHPAHTEVSCRSCHGEQSHRIVAMSSAVTLECSQCHGLAHGVEASPDFPRTTTCNGCHRAVHQVQQRLVLGVVPGYPNARPSEKFIDGLTCRSCHVAESVGNGGAPVTGSDVSCAGCHRPEFATVLSWWNEGTEQRVRLVEAFLRSAETRITEEAPAAARGALEDAWALWALVEQGGGQHNLPLAHQILTESVSAAEGAVREAGGAAPPAPELGRRPRAGLCTYCHYRLNDPWQFGEMSGAFHRDVLTRR